MLKGFKAHFREFLRSRPGHRFEERYRRHKQSKLGRSSWGKIVLGAGALLSIAIGVVLVFIPGPAVLFFLIAAGLLASESRRIARGLDRFEVWLRQAASHARRRWRGGSLALKGLIVSVAVLTAAAVVVGGFLLIF